MKTLYAALGKARTEEDVKAAYARHFNLDYDTSDRNDLYTPEVLFEFKFDRNLHNPKLLAATLAQTLYYVRRIKFSLDAGHALVGAGQAPPLRTGYKAGHMLFGDMKNDAHLPDAIKPLPGFLCLGSRDFAVITDTGLWKEYYTSSNFDWDLRPSDPDPRLVAALQVSAALKELRVFTLSVEQESYIFCEELSRTLKSQKEICFSDKKIITEANFEEVFAYWNRIFGDAVHNGTRASRYFVSDIQAGNTLFLRETGRAIFRVGQSGELKEKKIPARDYEHFWSLYEKVSDMRVVRGILAKIDRLSEDGVRRFHGEFFTPLAFACKALEYIDKTAGHWWESGEWRLWDMAAGTGNLEYYLPQGALRYCYLSTLYREDVEHLQKLFGEACIFQYDYLNDDVGNVFSKEVLPLDITWKLPRPLREDLQNPALKWIVLINPPFATAQAAGTSRSSKDGIADTAVRKIMHREDLGEVSRELFSQFIYRIKYEFANRETFFALFSKPKYIIANNDQKFRDKILDFEFMRGFVFSSANFAGTSKTLPFPISLIVWKLNQEKKLEDQIISLDVFNDNVEKIGVKIYKAIHKENFLNKWIKRVPADIKFPPFSAAITINTNNKDIRDRISKDFLASLMSLGNSFQNQNTTALFSGPYVSAGGLSIIPANFEQAMVVHAARRVVKVDWLNGADQFLRPLPVLPGGSPESPACENCSQEAWDIFVGDCTVWSLFSPSNQTAALRNVLYEGNIYQIHNNFFPFTIKELEGWHIADNNIALQLTSADDRFAAQWLSAKSSGRRGAGPAPTKLLSDHDALSAEALGVLDAARAVYQCYYANLPNLHLAKFKVETWDAGWWQIRMTLGDTGLGRDELAALRNATDTLRARVAEGLRTWGIVGD